MKPLTEIQRKVYDFVVEHKSNQGLPPTRAEISGHFGWSSNNAAQQHLKAIAKKGWITLLGNKRSRGVIINRSGNYRGAWNAYEFVDPKANTVEG